MWAHVRGPEDIVRVRTMLHVTWVAWGWGTGKGYIALVVRWYNRGRVGSLHGSMVSLEVLLLLV